MRQFITILIISLFSLSCGRREIYFSNEEMSNVTSQRDSLEELLYYTRAFYSDADSSVGWRYYIIGDEKTLLEKNIIARVSGLSREFKASNMISENHFIEVDKNECDTINIFGKHVRILGCFNPKYYHLSGSDKDDYHQLIIKNKDKFWRHSKYLIITHK